MTTPNDPLARHLPLTRADCHDLKDGPCPYVSCRHHLFLDVDGKTGSVRLNFPKAFDDDGSPLLEELPATCSLDVADRDGSTLETVGWMLNLSFERARQLETIALDTLRVRLARVDGIALHQPGDTFGVFDNPYTDGEESQ